MKVSDPLLPLFQDRLAECAHAVQAHFGATFSAMRETQIKDAMAHATFGGKRLRGFLVLESARMHDVAAACAIWPATAIEALHAYSLIHDDLPCMDDDDLRRGQPTVHRKWDEATAVLAGDALHSLAFEMVSRPEVGTEDVRADLALSLARAAGAQGMVLGQALDMAAESSATSLTLEDITELQRGKTGALIEWSACAGARLARADMAPLMRYAKALGLAFQIADDLLDVEGDSATVGKATGKDAAAGKATFVSLLGVDEAKRRARELVTDAKDALSDYGSAADRLREAAEFVVTRKN